MAATTPSSSVRAASYVTVAVPAVGLSATSTTPSTRSRALSTFPAQEGQSISGTARPAVSSRRAPDSPAAPLAAPPPSPSSRPFEPSVITRKEGSYLDKPWLEYSKRRGRTDPSAPSAAASLRGRRSVDDSAVGEMRLREALLGPTESVRKRRPRHVEVVGEAADVDLARGLVVAVFDGGPQRGLL